MDILPVTSNSRTFSRMATMGKNANHFKIYVKLLDTKEKYTLKNITQDMTIRKLKDHIEFAAGIPTHLQRLTYLDEGELIDSTDIKHNDIVPSGTICLRVWHQWSSLVEAVASNDIDEIKRLGVAPGAIYHTPVVDYMSRRAKENLLRERAFVALFIAAHRGHKRMCEKLIASGADVNAATPLGRTALHVATAAGHGTIVDTLLDSGANIDGEDSFGESALTISTKFNQKDCERHLFLWRWQQRADAVKAKPKLGERERFAHQYFDSALPVWLTGFQAQVYLSNILPPGEFEGTGFSASKRKPLKKRFEESDDEEEEEEEDEDEAIDEELEAVGTKLDEKKSKRSLIGQVGILEPIEERSVGVATPPGSAKPKKAKAKKAKGSKSKVKKFEEWLDTKKYEEKIQLMHKKIKEEEEKWRAEQNLTYGVPIKKCTHPLHNLHPMMQEKEVGIKSYDAWVREREKEKMKVRQREAAASKLDASQRVERRERIQREAEEHKPDIKELKTMFGSLMKRSPSPAKMFIHTEDERITNTLKGVKQSMLPT